MSLFRSEQGIGRGETAESRMEVPIFLFFTLASAILLLVLHLYVRQQAITVAAAISMLVFGITIIRVDLGVSILVVAMLLSPEIDVGNSISGEHNLQLRYDDVLIAVIFLGVMIKLTFEGNLSFFKSCPVNTGIILYFSSCIFSTLLALRMNLPAWDKRTAFFVILKMLEYYMIYFLVGNALRTRREIVVQLSMFFLVGLIVSGYAAGTVGTMERVGAPLEAGGTEPNTLGGYLVVVMCVALALYFHAPKLRYRLFFLLTIATAFYPFLFTLSRASYIALVAGWVVLCLACRKFAMLAMVAVILLASPIIMPEKVRNRVMYTFTTESAQEVTLGGQEMGISVDKSTQERLLVWRKVSFMLSLGGVFTLFGCGISWESVMDSQYARVVLETGLVGLALFIVLQINMLRTARQAYILVDDWLGKGLAAGMLATVVALNVHSMGTISFLIVRIMEPFWFLMAIMVVYRNSAIETRWEEYHAAQAREAAARLEAVAAATAPAPSVQPAR